MSRPCHASIALVGLPAAFALGCIPSARLVARLTGGADILQSGDGKPGAANVARTLGWKPGAATLGIDLVKGSATAGTARALGPAPIWPERSPSPRWPRTSPWCVAGAPPPRSAPRWPSTRLATPPSCPP